MKSEDERVRKAQKDKESIALVKETEVTRKTSVAAMEVVNMHAVEMKGHMKRIVEFREEDNSFEKAKAKAVKRACSIASLEKRCHLAGGPNIALNTKLNQLLLRNATKNKKVRRSPRWLFPQASWSGGAVGRLLSPLHGMSCAVEE